MFDVLPLQRRKELDLKMLFVLLSGEQDFRPVQTWKMYLQGEVLWVITAVSFHKKNLWAHTL